MYVVLTHFLGFFSSFAVALCSLCFSQQPQFMMWNVWDLHEVRAGGQVAGVGLSAAGFSRAPDSPNAVNLSSTHGHYGRNNQFSGSLRGQIMMDQHPMRQMKLVHEQRGSAGGGGGQSSYRQTAARTILHDEYGNVYSGQHVLARLNEAGKMLGPKSWIGLTRAFQQASVGSGGGGGDSGGLSPPEFSAVLEAFGLGVSEKELKLIFDDFDADGDGNISYNEFMHVLRGELTGTRAAVVKRAWEKIDQSRQTRVVLADLTKAFNPLADARVKNGDMTPAQAVQEFMTTFDFNDSDGWITSQDFFEYYTSVSATVDDDNVFSLMVWNSWLSSPGRR
jgi:Ca2+-binding EF-hand superfamily protein